MSDNEVPSDFLLVSVEGSVNGRIPGEYPRTFTVSDGTNEVMVTRVVTVVDTTAPTITFKIPNGVSGVSGNSENIIVEAGKTIDVSSDDYVEYSDNVEVLLGSVTIDGKDALDTALDNNQLGDYTLTYRVRDTTNLETSQERTITIQDTTKPTLTLSGDNPQTVQQQLTSMPYVDPGVMVSDIVDSEVEVSTSFSPAFDVTMPRIYALTYTATDDSGNVQFDVRSVVVKDEIKPFFTVTPPPTAFLEAHRERADYVVSVLAEDNIDGILPVVITVNGIMGSNDLVLRNVDRTRPLGTMFNILMTATDSAGNRETATQVVTLRDTMPPTITLTGRQSIALNNGDMFVEEGVSAFDVRDGDLTNRITMTTSPANPGVNEGFTITYRVQDEAGNFQTAIRTVSYSTASSAFPVGVVGGAVGGIIFLILLALLILLFVKRRRKTKKGGSISPEVVSMTTVNNTPTYANPNGVVTLVPTNVRSVSWYHGFISRKEAEALLHKAGDEAFLVRAKDKTLDELILSVGAGSKAAHYRITITADNEYAIEGVPCGDFGSNVKSIVDHLKLNKEHLPIAPKHPVERASENNLPESHQDRQYVRFLRKPRTLAPKINLYAKCITRNGDYVFAAVDRSSKLPTIALYFPTHAEPKPATTSPLGPYFAKAASTTEGFDTFVQVCPTLVPPPDLLLFSKVIEAGALSYVPLPNTEGLSLYESVNARSQNGAAQAANSAAAAAPSGDRVIYAAHGDEVASPQVMALYQTVQKPGKKAQAPGDDVQSPAIHNMYQTVRKPEKENQYASVSTPGLYESVDSPAMYQNVDGAAMNGEALYESVGERPPQPNADGLIYAALNLQPSRSPAPERKPEPTIYAAIQTPKPAHEETSA